VVESAARHDQADTGPTSGTPFVGRESELEQLRDALHDTVQRRGRLALIRGEPGIGKSRLAEQLAMHARDEGVRVFVGRCWEGAGAPAYWPWVQVYRTIIRSTADDDLRKQLGAGAADIAQMVVELRERFGDIPRTGELESDSARFQLFDSSTTFLRRAARASPLLVVIEDLHAADLPTALYLRFVASELGDAPVMVVSTYRDTELMADTALSEVVGEIVRQPTTLTLDLAGLGEGPVRQFIEATAGIKPRSTLVNAIVRETGGNPLFLGEAIRLLAAEGRLGDVGIGQALQLPLPAGIRDVILRRVRHLEPETADLLVRASALGPEFATEVLRHITGTSPEEALDRMGEASRAGLVGPVPAGLDRFRFTHDLIRETLYDELPPGQRMSLHRRIADALQSLYGSAPEAHLAELAYHYMEAARGGDSQPDPTGTSAAALAIRYARQAGDLALRSLAYEEAARLYRMGLALLDVHAPADTVQRLEMLLRLGEVEARAGDLPACRQTFLAAAELARRQGAPEALARAVLGYSGRLPWLRPGRDTNLIPLVQDALVLLGGTDDRLRVRLLTRLACAWRSSPEHFEQSATLSQQAVDLARTLNDPSTLSYALAGRYWATWWPENPEERLAIAKEMIAVAESSGDAERRIDAQLMLYMAYTETGEMLEARQAEEQVRRLANELRQPSQLWLGVAPRALLALLDGDLALAEDMIARELNWEDPITSARDERSACIMHSFLLRREQGRVAETASLVRSAVDEFPWYPVHRAALVQVLIGQGRDAEARSLFRALASSEFTAFYRDNEWLLGVSLAAEACSFFGDAEAARVLYAQLAPFAGRQAIGHAEGSAGAVDRYLGLLAAVDGDLETAERHLTDAIRVNERIGARLLVAHSQHDLATVLRRRGGAGDLNRAAVLDAAALTVATSTGAEALRTAIVSVQGEQESDLTDGGPTTSAGRFHREGEYWTIAFDGETTRVRDAKGLRYLARLLAEPGREFHALDLARGPAEVVTAAAAAVGDFATDPFEGAGPRLDAEAKAAYRARLGELEDEVRQAEAWNDPEAAARARTEIDFLHGELAGSLGLGGRDRKSGSAAERARLSVTRAIRSAMSRIADGNPALGRHLEATVRTGTFCSYQPDPRVPAAWEL
jgi:AAA ATPase domain